MAVQKIRANYEQLTKVAARFSQQASLARQSLQKIRQKQEALQAGDWVGQGAQAFYAEMNTAVMPGLNRLVQALDQAADTTRQIHTLMQQAEADAAALFRLDGSGASGLSATGAAFRAGAVGGGVRAGSGTTSAAPGAATVSGGAPFIQGAGDGTLISPNDVNQGQLGDCGLMASLAAIAQTNPDVIWNMIRPNSDGSYTVTFKLGAVARERWMGQFSWPDDDYIEKEIRVTPDFPAVGTVPKYAGYGDSSRDGTPEIWVPLIEKAYAQMGGGYDTMEATLQPAEVMAQITGKPSHYFTPDEMSIDELAGHYDKGSAIVVNTPKDPSWTAFIVETAHHMVPNHDYYVTKVDRAAQTVTLRNPWGWHVNETTPTIDEFQQSFELGAINPTR